MNIKEFGETFAGLAPVLASVGFEWTAGSWRLVTDDYVLVFEAPADNLAAHFRSGI